MTTKARSKKGLLDSFGHLPENVILFSNGRCPRTCQFTFKSLSFPLGN